MAPEPFGGVDCGGPSAERPPVDGVLVIALAEEGIGLAFEFFRGRPTLSEVRACMPAESRLFVVDAQEIPRVR
jgi:hypothetical protein